MSGMVQLQTLAALSNLLILAYPIMFRHSGKILCTLIAYIRRLDDTIANNPTPTVSPSTTNELDHNKTVLELRESIRQRAIYVAAMALVVGESTATTVLNKVVECDKYDSGIIDIVHEIRCQAKALTK